MRPSPILWQLLTEACLRVEPCPWWGTECGQASFQAITLFSACKLELHTFFCLLACYRASLLAGNHASLLVCYHASLFAGVLTAGASRPQLVLYYKVDFGPALFKDTAYWRERLIPLAKEFSVCLPLNAPQSTVPDENFTPGSNVYDR